jgi:hypothetical protein
MGKAVFELVHHTIAHPLYGIAQFAMTLAIAAERAAARLHDATARRAWGSGA